MKNIFFIAIFSIILIFLFSSCGKTCTCSKWLNGVEGSAYTVPLKSDETDCSAKNTIVIISGAKTGIECK